MQLGCRGKYSLENTRTKKPAAKMFWWFLFTSLVIGTTGEITTCPMECECNNITVSCQHITDAQLHKIKFPQNYTTLNLANNTLTNFPPKEHFANTSFKTFILYNNSLTQIPDFPNTATAVDLRYNKISGQLSAGNFTTWCNRLFMIHLSNNHITRINAKTFAQCKNLAKFALDYNRIQEIQRDAFNNLQALQLLNLTGNSIKRIAPGAFNNLPALKLLGLTRNSIKRIAPGAFRNSNKISTIWLNDNNLTSIQANVFPRSLNEVYLQSNQIRDIAPGAFFNALRYIYLENNNLTTISASWFVYPNVKASGGIFLGYNNLTCDYPYYKQLMILFKLERLVESHVCRFVYSYWEGDSSDASFLKPWKFLQHVFGLILLRKLIY